MGGSLSGVRVLDFSSVVTGPFCTMLMGDLGADIIKVESAGGDILRHLNLTFKAGVGSWFVSFNRNKRSIQLDLKRSEAREAILQMAAQSEVLVQNFRPGVMERLGLDYPAVRACNPKIVYLSISGFGAEGPYAHKPCYDPVIQGLSGLAFVQGGQEQPVFVRMAIADKMTSMNAIYHVLAALDEALRDPQLAINQTFVEYDHPVAGRVRGVNVPGKFSETPPEIRHHAPGLGEHTVEILSEFGFGQTEIASLLEAKAASQGQRPYENGLAQAATA